jgi:hypothetical protein
MLDTCDAKPKVGVLITKKAKPVRPTNNSAVAMIELRLMGKYNVREEEERWSKSSKVDPSSFRACPIRASGFLKINITLLSPHPELLLTPQITCRNPRNNAASWAQFAIPTDKFAHN